MIQAIDLDFSLTDFKAKKHPMYQPKKENLLNCKNDIKEIGHNLDSILNISEIEINGERQTVSNDSLSPSTNYTDIYFRHYETLLLPPLNLQGGIPTTYFTEITTIRAFSKNVWSLQNSSKNQQSTTLKNISIEYRDSR